MKFIQSDWQCRFHMLLLLSAIETVLAFSSFGFINLPPISLTTMHIPVLLAALAYGRWGGAILGGVFGILSAWIATNLSFIPGDRIFSPFLSGNPLGSIIAGIGTRILFGWIAGCVFAYLKDTPHKYLTISLASYILTGLHGLLVFTACAVYFPALGFTPLTLLERMQSFSHLYDACLAALLVPLLYHWLTKKASGQAFYRIFAQTYTMLFDTKNSRPLLAFSGALFFISATLVWHFISQIQNALFTLQGDLPPGLPALMLGWGLQFVIAIAAVSLLLFAIITYYYNLSAEALRKASHDPLTALYNKGSIVERINACLKSTSHGAFLMMDVDHFKAVNDQFGHPAGDAVLCSVAACLRTAIPGKALIGRLGGDEFCVYLPKAKTTKSSLDIAQQILDHIASIRLPDNTSLHLSIGLVLRQQQTSFNELYAAADQALYDSKKTGRNRCSLYQETDITTA